MFILFSGSLLRVQPADWFCSPLIHLAFLGQVSFSILCFSEFQKGYGGSEATSEWAIEMWYVVIPRLVGQMWERNIYFWEEGIKSALCAWVRGKPLQVRVDWKMHYVTSSNLIVFLSDFLPAELNVHFETCLNTSKIHLWIQISGQDLGSRSRDFYFIFAALPINTVSLTRAKRCLVCILCCIKSVYPNIQILALPC